MNLVARLTLDTAGFTRPLQLSKREVQSWAMTMKAKQSEAAASASMFRTALVTIATAATSVGVAIKAGVSSLINFGSEIQDVVDRTGMAAESVQEWKAKAEDAGKSIDTVTRAREQLARALAQARAGDEEFTKSLRALGVSADQIANGSLQEVFDTLGNNIKYATVEAGMLNDVLKVFSKGGGAMVGVFKQGFGETVSSGQTTSKLDAAGDAAAGWWRSMKATLADKLGGAIFNTVDFLTLGNAGWSKRSSDRLSAEEKERIGTADATVELTDAQKKKAEDARKEEERKQKELDAANKEYQKAERDLIYSRLTTNEQRIAFIKEEIKAEERKRDSYSLGSKERIESNTRLTGLQQQVEEMGRKDEDKTLSDFWKNNKPETDSLTDVGNFLGSSGNQIRPLEQKLDAIRAEIVALKRVTEGNGRNQISLPKT